MELIDKKKYVEKLIVFLKEEGGSSNIDTCYYFLKEYEVYYDEIEPLALTYELVEREQYRLNLTRKGLDFKTFYEIEKEEKRNDRNNRNKSRLTNFQVYSYWPLVLVTIVSLGISISGFYSNRREIPELKDQIKADSIDVQELKSKMYLIERMLNKPDSLSSKR
jgi:hypothetical protein